MAPRDIAPGEDYAEQIISAIESCPVLLLVLSESSNRSQYVRNEVERAIAKRKVVIPLRSHDVQLSRSRSKPGRRRWNRPSSYWQQLSTTGLQRKTIRVTTLPGVWPPPVVLTTQCRGPC
jgi:hypothetical protein